MTLAINEIHEGDCLELMKLVPDKSVDMILCDLPYGTTACKWDTIIPFEPLWAQYERVIKDNGAIVLTAAQPFTSALIMSNPKLFRHSWVWDKQVAGNFALAKKRPMTIHEDVVVFGKKSVKYFPIMTDAESKNIRPVNKGSKSSEATPVASGIAKSGKDYNPKKRYPKSILTYSKYNAECNQLNRVHPTQKPVALFEYLIKTYTNEGETVLDNCIGSGTTAIAAINTRRNFIGIEQDAGYVEVARNRIKEAQEVLV